MELRDDRSEIVHYSYKNYPIYVSRALLSTYNNYEAAPHWHEDFEFIYVYSGQMDYYVDGKAVTIGPKQGIFVNSYHLHYGFSKEKKECDFVCILFHPSLLAVSTAYEQEYLLPVLKNQALPYILLDTGEKWQFGLLNSLIKIYEVSEKATATLEIVAEIFKIWTLIYENSENAKAKRVTDKDLSTLKDMVGYIQKHYSETISLDDIAKAGYIGQSKCNRLFKKYLGTTPGLYLNHYRLDKSIWYLKNTDMTITEIASKMGFSGSSYFAESFHKQYGISPSKIRKSEK